MATRKLVRDFLLPKRLLLHQQLLASQQVSRWPRIQLLLPIEHSLRREFSVFNEFSKKIKGEVDRNQEFQQSIKEFKEKSEELKGVKENLKARLAETSNGGSELVKWRNAERSRLLSSCTSM